MTIAVPFKEGTVPGLQPQGGLLRKYVADSWCGTAHTTCCGICVFCMCRFSPLVGSEEGGVVLHTLAIPVKWNKRTAPDSYLVRRDTEEWLVDLTRSVAKDRATAMCVR